MNDIERNRTSNVSHEPRVQMLVNSLTNRYGKCAGISRD
jgi:hypothetical protein